MCTENKVVTNILFVCKTVQVMYDYVCLLGQGNSSTWTRK